MSQTIFRVARPGVPYTQLSNAMLRNNRISWAARGMLGFILSYPSDWHFSVEWFCNETGIDRKRAWRIVKELLAHDYCRRERLRLRDGTLGPVEYLFSDAPLSEGVPVHKPQSQNGSMVHKPRSHKPHSGKCPPTKKVGTKKQGSMKEVLPLCKGVAVLTCGGNQ